MKALLLLGKDLGPVSLCISAHSHKYFVHRFRSSAGKPLCLGLVNRCYQLASVGFAVVVLQIRVFFQYRYRNVDCYPAERLLDRYLWLVAGLRKQIQCQPMWITAKALLRAHLMSFLLYKVRPYSAAHLYLYKCKSEALLAKLLNLQEWASRVYETPPSLSTLRRWAREGRIYPAPEIHGKEYKVSPDAIYVSSSKKNQRLNTARRGNENGPMRLTDRLKKQGF
ncbi:excisionase [Citrobacter portucalensis]|uniref:excisionase n=1 Tax=Citrobacter portucalensis TaxID=1639133 RepID=UPI00397D35B4